MKYLQLLNEKRVDALIFTSEILIEEYYHYIMKMNVPMVLLSTKSEKFDVPFVKVDDYAASFDGTEYLIKKGHRKIAMISGDEKDIIAGLPRINGFKDAMKKHNLPINHEQIVIASFSFKDGVVGLRQLMDQAPDITAIFAASDEVAIGVLSEAYKSGIKIPEDLSIIGYDNLVLAEMSTPPLTSVAQPLEKMGEKAASMVEHQEGAGALPLRSVLPHSIAERQSVRTFG